MEKIRQEGKASLRYTIAFVRWMLTAVFIGLLCGAVGALFAMAVEWATETRTAHGWLLYLLPLGGLCIAGLYRLLRLPLSVGTDEIITTVRTQGRVPVQMAPAIFLSTTLTHLLGGSAGREGAALQLGGSIGAAVGDLTHPKEDSRRIFELCGMAALFSALFGTPLTAAIFVLEIIEVGRLNYRALLPCIASAVTAQLTARALGAPLDSFPLAAGLQAITPLSVVQAAGLGVALALVIALALFLWPVQIMDLMSNKHHLSLLGAPYLRVIGFSYVFNMLSSIYVSAQRSVENAGFGMKLFGMSTVLNTGMNYLLIFGKCGFPMLGVEGAAIATLLSRVAEFAVCLFCALRSRVIPLDLKALFRPGWEMLRRFVKYASPVMANELFWGLGNSLLTVILGHMTISVEFLAANAVMGNLNRLFLVVCFGLGAATAVMIGKAIGEGQSHDELMDLSRTLSWVTILVGAALAVIALALVPLLFQPVVFPLFKLYDLSAHLATTLAVTGFACIPFHAYSISAVTGILRAGGDVFWSTALDLAPQWLVALPLTALLALVLDADPWFVSLAIQAESFIKCPICLWRIRSRKWIHDVTLPEGER